VARALLLDAPVVLLDEPTAGFDSHAERLVVEALTRLVQGRTVVMTTHRPALTRLATRTVDIHDGVIQHLAADPGSFDLGAEDAVQPSAPARRNAATE
jgi:ABC-type transport system involved in cytochrome bd biosynthesis fused ATPase/permease subunit